MPRYVFPKVDLPKVDRSNFSLDKAVFMSFAPSTIRIPWCKDVLPNDHWEIDLSAAIESMPMLSPMYGRWKARWAFFFEPYTNIYGFMDNNKRQSTEEILKSNLLTYSIPLGQVVGSYDGPIPDTDSSQMFYTFYESTGANLVGDAISRWINRAKVNGSSIWCDLGWPQGYYGYPDKVVEIEDINFVVGDNDRPIYIEDNIGSYTSNLNGRFNGTSYDFPTSYKSEELHLAKVIGYLDIIRNYYVNNQENRVAYIGYSDGEESFTNRVDFVNLEVLDYILMYVRTISFTIGGPLYNTLQQNGPLPNYDGSPGVHFDAIDFLKSWERSYFIPNGGCFLSPYAMDLNRGLMNASQGNFQSYMSTDDNGRISVTQMYTANKLQELINILDLTGGRFSDWLNALWAVDIKGKIDKPIYLGSHTEFIATTDIVSPSTTAGSTAGQQTGFSAGGFGREFKKISFNSDQYGIIYCVFNMIPDVYYSTGFKREDLKTKFTDIYNPRMSRIGYQDVPAKVLTALPNTMSTSVFVSPYETYDGSILDIGDVGPIYKPWLQNPSYTFENGEMQYLRLDDSVLETYDPNTIVGRQVAWAEYMADVDETRGYFALNGSLSYWTLNRTYKENSKIVKGGPSLDAEETNMVYIGLNIEQTSDNYSTYVLPSEWNKLFADSSPDAENFRLYCKFNVFTKRAIPSRSFPQI